MIKSTIEDKQQAILVKGQLKIAQISWLDLQPHEDFEFDLHKFAVYTSTLCSPTGLRVYDAWIVVGGGSTGVYERTSYPTTTDAVAQHIGRLILDKKIFFVAQGNAASKRGSRKKK